MFEFSEESRLSVFRTDRSLSFRGTPSLPVHLVARIRGTDKNPQRDLEKEVILSARRGLPISELPGRGTGRALRLRSGVSALRYARRRGRTDGRTDARTPSLPYWCRCSSCGVYQRRRAPGRDATGVSVIRRDLRSAGERQGAGRERVVKLTPGD